MVFFINPKVADPERSEYECSYEVCTVLLSHSDLPFRLHLDIDVFHRLQDGIGNRDPLNLIFPAYFELMTRFPTVQSEGVMAEIIH